MDDLLSIINYRVFIFSILLWFAVLLSKHMCHCQVTSDCLLSSILCQVLRHPLIWEVLKNGRTTITVSFCKWLFSQTWMKLFCMKGLVNSCKFHFFPDIFPLNFKLRTGVREHLQEQPNIFEGPWQPRSPVDFPLNR